MKMANNKESMSFWFISLTFTVFCCKAIQEKTEAEIRCPDGWLFFDEKCYLFNYEATIMTWREGQEECESLGGYLAEITNEQQQQYVMTTASLYEEILGTKSWFIGLSDQSHEGRWVWEHSFIDSTNFTYWAPDQPDDDGDILNDCAVLGSEQNYEWISVHCDTSGFDVGTPICMREATHSGELSTVALKNGTESKNGNVYATNSDGVFGPVCDDEANKNNNAANVVCRQLGFNSGVVHAHFADVAGFVMDDVICTGNENSIQECSYITTNNCGPSEAFAVQCSD